MEPAEKSVAVQADYHLARMPVVPQALRTSRTAPKTGSPLVPKGQPRNSFSFRNRRSLTLRRARIITRFNPNPIMESPPRNKFGFATNENRILVEKMPGRGIFYPRYRIRCKLGRADVVQTRRLKMRRRIGSLSANRSGSGLFFLRSASPGDGQKTSRCGEIPYVNRFGPAASHHQFAVKPRSAAQYSPRRWTERPQ